MHALQGARLVSFEYVPGLHEVHSPAALVTNVLPHGGDGSSPGGHTGQDKHLILVLLLLSFSRTVYVS